MRDRRNLGLMMRLVSVQRAQRIGAEVAMRVAADSERRARALEDEAHQASAVARQQWLDYVDEPGFSPDYSKALRAWLAEREQDVENAAAVTRRKGDVRAQRELDWQRSEADVRSTEITTRRLRRKVERCAEERRASEFADRTTYDWMRS